MTTLETKVAPAKGEAVDVAVEFRVSRPGLPRRRLRLVGPRYTLGSGPECSVRLEDPSLRPLHAVLIREFDRVILRACGAPISINGRAVMEATLSVGDCLQLGAYVFELVSAQTSAAPGAATAEVTPLPVVTSAALVSPNASKPTAAADKIADRIADKIADRIVPRRRLSFVETAEAMANEVVAAAPPSAEPAAATTLVLQPAPNLPSDEDVTSEPIALDESAELDRLAQLRRSPGSSPDERAAALVDQHRALLANERRWQERSRRQMERFRQREQHSREQIEQLLVVQESAERRARQAEDAVQSLSVQLAELAGQISSLSGTAIPGVEDRLLQHQSDTTIALNNQLDTVEVVRERLDQLQLAISDVQSESRLIRQEASANRADQLEAAANADHLESLIRRLSDTCESNRTDCDAKYDELRESLFVNSKKIADTNSQLEETRQNNHGLSALVQQLRSSLANLQQENQKFATSEQYVDTQRLLQNGDDRIARLIDDIESQQQQIQQEFESLRLRLDESDEALDRINRSASDALTRAIEAQSMPSRVVPASSEHGESADDRRMALSDFYTPTDFTDDVPADALITSDAAEGIEAISDSQFSAESLSPKPFNAEMYSAEVHELDWADEPETTSSSLEGHLQEVAPNLDSLEKGDLPVRNRVQLSGFLHNPLLDDGDHDTAKDEELLESAAEPGDSEILDESYDSPMDMTYQPDQPFHFSPSGDLLQGMRDDSEVIVENEASDASIPEVDNTMEDYVDGSTYQYDPSASYSKNDEPGQSEEALSDQEVIRGPRSAAEILASFGLSLKADEDEEVGGDKTEFLPLRDTSETNSLAASSVVDNSLNIEKPADPAGRSSGSGQPQAVAVPNQKEEANEDEDSIEAYMNRLLKRVQGTSETTKFLSEPKTHVVEPTRVAEASKGSQDQSPTATAAETAAVVQPALPPQPAPDSPYIPRSQAPERTSNMAAMRELANSSARTAIAASAKQRMLNQIIFKFALFGMGMLAGLFTLVGTGFAVDKWMLVAMCCIGLGAFYLMEAIGIRKQLIQTAAAEEVEVEG